MGADEQVLPGLDRSALDSAIEPISELADDYPSLFLPIIDQIMPYLLHLIAPPRDGLPIHTYSSYPLSDLDFEEWVPVANQATEMILFIIAAYPKEFERPERIPYIHALVGSLLGHQISGLGGQMDCTDWLDPGANVSPVSRCSWCMGSVPIMVVLTPNQLSDEDYDYPAYPEEALVRLSEALGTSQSVCFVGSVSLVLMAFQDTRYSYQRLVGICTPSPSLQIGGGDIVH